MKVHKKNLKQVAKQVLEAGKGKKGAHVVALHGDLGAGKTTFAQVLAEELGVVGDVASPTFVIMKIYDSKNSRYTKLVHIDAYRIESDSEGQVIPLREYMTDADTIVLVEWPEHIEHIMPRDALHLTFVYLDEEHRDILGL